MPTRLFPPGVGGGGSAQFDLTKESMQVSGDSGDVPPGPKTVVPPEAGGNAMPSPGPAEELAAGFTVSASWNGDKHNTLYQLLTLASQHGMVWVGLGLAPGNNHSKGSIDDLNRTGASIGLMAQAHADQGIEGIGASEFRTAELLGKRVAEAAQRWRAAPLAKAA